MSNILSFSLARSSRQNHEDGDDSWVELAKNPAVLNHLIDQILPAPRQTARRLPRSSRIFSVHSSTNNRLLAV